MANQRRAYRVADKVRTLVANELIRAADPRFNLVTVTSVVVTPDLRHAKIYWVVTGDDDRIDETAEAFEGARGSFKRLIGKELGVRFVPDVHFHYDDTLDTVEEVERLIQRANNNKE